MMVPHDIMNIEQVISPFGISLLEVPTGFFVLPLMHVTSVGLPAKDIFNLRIKWSAEIAVASLRRFS